MVYPASLLKRHRATNFEMAVRSDFLIAYAKAQAPVTVRQLFYAATVSGVPGIEKTEQGYCKVQAQVLALRRAGQMPYGHVTDSTRYMRKPNTHDGWEAALMEAAQLYRKALWADTEDEVEIWLEKSALAGVLYPVTSEFDVPLMCTGGYTSETFAHEAVDAMAGRGKTLVIYSLYDFDCSGKDAESSPREKVERFGREYGVPVAFYSLGLSLQQVMSMNLPTRPAKGSTVADRRWAHDFAAELDAIPPDTLRDMVREAIERHLPAEQLEYLKTVEQLERATAMEFLGAAA